MIRGGFIKHPIAPPCGRPGRVDLGLSISRRHDSYHVQRRRLGAEAIEAFVVIFCFLTVSGASAQAQTLDRVVAAVGRTAITESDVLQEYRLEKFLDDGRVPVDLPGP
ncbi:MAG: hypothetical protein ACRD2O_07580, partial [Terriglobia bacterium]